MLPPQYFEHCSTLPSNGWRKRKMLGWLNFWMQTYWGSFIEIPMPSILVKPQTAWRQNKPCHAKWNSSHWWYLREAIFLEGLEKRDNSRLSTAFLKEKIHHIPTWGSPLIEWIIFEKHTGWSRAALKEPPTITSHRLLNLDRYWFTISYGFSL